jgi:hypothetical protein
MDQAEQVDQVDQVDQVEQVEQEEQEDQEDQVYQVDQTDQIDNNEELVDIEPTTDYVKTEHSSTTTPVAIEETSNTNGHEEQSVPQIVDIESNVTVKCMLLPTDQVITLAKPLRTSVQELMLQFANDLKFELEYLQIIHSDSSKCKHRDFEFQSRLNLSVFVQRTNSGTFSHSARLGRGSQWYRTIRTHISGSDRSSAERVQKQRGFHATRCHNRTC